MPLTRQVHGVIIVHGIGDQKQGDTLAEFSKALCDTLWESKQAADAGNGKQYPTIELVSGLGDKPASVTLHIAPPLAADADRKTPATWICREAFWNDAFPAPKPTEVLGWGVFQNLRAQWNLLTRMMADPSNSGFDQDEPEAGRRPRRKKKIPAPVQTASKDEPLTLPIWFRAVISASQAIAIVAIGVPLVALTPFLLGALWILNSDFFPKIGPLEQLAGWARQLNPFLTTGLGDVERYVDHPVWAANARGRVEQLVITMLEDPDVSDITIVAHSMGSVVAYHALTEGGEVARVAAGHTKKVTLITVGAAINRVFGLVCTDDPRMSKRNRKKAEEKYGHLQISKPLAKSITAHVDGQSDGGPKDRFFWVDIFARQDPVASGPISKYIYNKAGVGERQHNRIKVINKDSIFFDHTCYWQNKELVMPRIIRLINGDVKEYPWPEIGVDKAKFRKRAKIAMKSAIVTGTVEFLLIWGFLGGVAWLVLRALRVF